MYNPIIEEKPIVIKDGKDKLVILQNPDKLNHEKWTAGRDIGNIIRPYRCMLIGPPNSGKGAVVNNLILKAEPPYDVIKVWHVCKEQTTEWDDVVCDPDEDIVDEIPPLNSWDGEKQNLLIIDDVDLAHLNRETKTLLDRTCGFTSTHSNVTVCILCQDILQSKASLRRYMNCFAIWKIKDIDSMATMARRMGIKRKHFFAIVKKAFKSPHDFLFFDSTVGSPAPLRLNLYNPILIPEDE